MALAFDRFRFDTVTGRLWSGADELRLTPKAAAVLTVLLDRAGEPVSKETLFQIVWPGIAVSDDALTTCVQELRRTLDDDARQPRFIETRHRRGYRFIATIAADEPDASRASAPPPASDAAPLPGPPAPAAAPDDVSTIAVLPFADMSPGRDHDYLCEGLAEELINALTHVDGLRVAARTTSFQYRDRGADVRDIGRQLGVGSLLEGSVRRAGDRLRVTVQLVETATGYHRWSERFDRPVGDVFAIEDEIAERVATLLRGGVLTRREKQGLHRVPTDTAAYEYYLRGRQHMHRLTAEDLQEAADLFARAIAHDPGYGPAVAGRATVHATLYEWFGGKDEDLECAERYSQEALALAPHLAEAHVARGYALSQSRRYDEASAEFEQAIAINPSLFDAYYLFARTAFAQGRIERSAELFRRAADVQVEDFASPMLLQQSLAVLGRHEEALAAAREGIRRGERILALNPNDVRVLSLGTGSQLALGNIEGAMEWTRRALELRPNDVGVLINAACVHARLARKEEALALLERVLANGCGKRDWIEHDPDYDILRDDPRFQRLMARLR